MEHHGENNHFFWGLLLVTAGSVWTAYNLGLVKEELWNYWPLMLVVVGLWKLLNASVLRE